MLLKQYDEKVKQRFGEPLDVRQLSKEEYRNWKKRMTGNARNKMI